MCVFHSSQFTFMTRNQAAQPPNIIVDTKSGGNSAPDLVSKSVVAFQANFRFFSADWQRQAFSSSDKKRGRAELQPASGKVTDRVRVTVT